LCKSLPVLTSIKILKFAKDRVVLRAYDNSRDTASKMQLKLGEEEVRSSSCNFSFKAPSGGGLGKPPANYVKRGRVSSGFAFFNSFSRNTSINGEVNEEFPD
jgi:hypothetical protein